MFTAALFITAKKVETKQCPPTDEWINKMWHVPTIQYYSAIKRNEADFLGGPVVKPLCFHCRGPWFNPWSGNWDPTCCNAAKNKKEWWSTDTCYNVGEPWKHYAKQKEARHKGHILYDSIYMTCPELEKWESRLVVSRGGERREGGVSA